ncbi:hypothetical protein [Pseudonocardia sp. GCM10023141]|uniref:Rv3212 family protein n=1 Tax=Pseudonocardia sp. GCM10023141 TaxID=3252653 RepID=UPI00360F2E9E
MPTRVASSTGTGPRQRIRPERRSRGDVIVAVVLTLGLLAAAIVLWRTSDAAGTESVTATAPFAETAPAGAVPAGFTEAWHAPSAATPELLVAGSGVVTADGSAVTGHDARTGATLWSYTRDVPLCTVGSAFPTLDNGLGRVLALYQGHTGWCSELTELHAGTGARAAARNPDLRPGTQLISNSTLVAGTGGDYIEVLRYDLVLTLEYGNVPTPVQNDKQPRTGCAYGSTAIADGRLGVIERCPGEATDRLSVISPEGKDGSDKPQQLFSVLLPAAGATLVAVSGDREVVALPNPARLMVLDKDGLAITTSPLDVPAADLTRELPGRVAPVQAAAGTLFWWTGSETVALNALDLTPMWTLPATLGPAAAYGSSLLVPVRGGLADVDPERGTVRRTIPVTRADPDAPVRIAAAGDVLVEKRGPEVVALTPTP